MPVWRTGTFFPSKEIFLFVMYVINEYMISGYLVPAPTSLQKKALNKEKYKQCHDIVYLMSLECITILIH